MRRIILCLFLLIVPVAYGRQKSGYKGFTFSPDGTYLLAVHSDHGSDFIYKIPIDTGKATRLTSISEGFEGVPSFSADGKQIAYSFSPGSGTKSHIIIANADGSVAHSLTNSAPGDSRPLFSPDNKTFIFARSGYYGSYSPIAQPAEHEWDFYTSDLKGENVRQITSENFYMVSRMCVSPDGKSVMFVSAEDHGNVIVIYSLEQPPHPKQVLEPHVKGEPGEPLLNDPNFLPDGKSIIFLAASERKWKDAFDYDVYRMDLKTEQIEKLTEKAGYSQELQLSRDGKTAVFLGDVSNGWLRKETKVFLLNLATRKTTPVEVTGIE
jgi:Tol biopolymer transport system component